MYIFIAASANELLRVCQFCRTRINIYIHLYYIRKHIFCQAFNAIHRKNVLFKKNIAKITAMWYNKVNAYFK